MVNMLAVAWFHPSLTHRRAAILVTSGAGVLCFFTLVVFIVTFQYPLIKEERVRGRAPLKEFVMRGCFSSALNSIE